MNHKELKIYIFFIAVLNLGIFTGTVPSYLLFDTEKIFSGQLWRIFTHAFVHVSWYHLLLDGVAFIMLYSQLQAKSLAKRSFYLGSAAFGSMAAVAFALPHMEAAGYCGLSGIDHGLMVICGMEMLTSADTDRTEKTAGAVSVTLVIAKSLFEAITGHMFLEFLHFNMMGSPVAVSHIGGAAGGLIAALAAMKTKKQDNKPVLKTSISPLAS